MEVEYELTQEDLIALNRYHRRNAPQPAQAAPLNAFVGVLVFILIAAGGLYYLLSDDALVSQYLMMIPFVIMGAALAVLGMIVYARLTAMRQLFRVLKQGRNAEKGLGWRRVSIDAEAIRNVSEFSATTYLWHGIDKVGATLDHAYFYISTTTAIVVPGRAFRDDRAFKEFVDAARRYYRMGEVGPEAAGWKSPTGVRPSGDAEGIVRRPSEPEA